MIQGPVFPIVTAFENEEIDKFSTFSYGEFLRERGAKVLYVTGNTSRLNLLGSEENITLNKWLSGLRHNIVLIGSTRPHGATRILQHEAYEISKHVDMLSVVFPERFYRESQVVEFFQDIYDSSHCPLMIHAWPLKGGAVNWPISLLKKLSGYCKAIKDDCGDEEFTNRIIEETELDVITSGGSKLQFTKHKAEGYLVGLGSVFPELALKFYEEWQNQNREEIERILKLEQAFFEKAKSLGWHIALKAALAHLGLMKVDERRPLVALREEDREEIKSIVESLEKEVI